ncbi:MAG: response regulator [Flavobacteriaceae bacterium]|nr:response regulator [Bacteroidia bacterium]NNK81588.1 response regulator [Flavobacteriaceae bacterium]
MSRIRYYIFAFFLLVFNHLHTQDRIEGDKVLLKNTIEVKINNAELSLNNGDFQESIFYLKNALQIANQIDSKVEQGKINSKLAHVYIKLNELDSSDVYISRAIEIQSNLDDEINLAISRFTNGLIYLERQQYIQAVDLFTNSSIVFEENNLDEYSAKVALYQGITHINLENYSKANTFLDKALLLSKRSELPLIESAAHIYSGKINFIIGKNEQAIVQINEGLELSNAKENIETISEGYNLLSQLYAIKKNYKLAYDNSILYQILRDSIIHEDQLKNIQLSQAEINPTEINETTSNTEDTTSVKEKDSLGQLTTILSVALITILSLLTLSLYKNNNIRLKTNNMLYKKNKELLTEKEKAEIAAKTKSNFLSTVTHELRTPLYAVTGLTNMLLEEDPKPNQIQHLKSLKFSGDYLLTFINDILQINKIEANKVELDPEIFNLKNKVENVIAALNNSAMDNNVHMHYYYDKSLPETFVGDQLKLSQILINLIGNSIKFTKDGDIWINVSKMSQKDKIINLKLEIKDNGIGITKEKQESMFESFSQGSVQINRKYGGTGLGLSIVKGLVDILKGKIYLKSELGKGTSFFIEIPLEETNEKVQVECNQYLKDFNKLDLEHIKILVVEDNKINQMITKKILTKMKLNCDLVDNGEDAVKMVKDNNYDIVLMDIHMPGISGIEATKQIRAFNKEQIIFALTAVTIEDKMKEFEEAGFNDIIPKPFKQEDLVKKLYTVLENNQKPTSV